ncbi:MAG: DUF3084 domain-containing protein [Synergistaceae bacterium]|nr:DUF3084 domain-containing protein [Synergistaceae bacterium]
MQPQIFSGANWTLIVSIIAGSAVLAYLGDVLGSKYGKQRISIFGLRPKYTSRLITAFTGIFISVTVLTIMSFFSENVRTALFTMKYLRQELDRISVQLQNNRVDLEEAQNELLSNRLELRSNLERLMDQQALLQTATLSLDLTRFDLETLRNDRDLLTSEKNDLEASVVSLREESQELRRELDVMRLGPITVQANALLAQAVVPPETSRPLVQSILSSLEDVARIAVAKQRNVAPGDVRLALDVLEESEVMTRATDFPDRLYIRLLAAENIAAGENVKIRLESDRSYLLYSEGETLYRTLIDPRTPGFGAEEALHNFLRRLKNHAIENGVRPDPATNSVGSLEGEDFFETVEKLKTVWGPTIINAVALEDIYTEGPVRIKIILE